MTATTVPPTPTPAAAARQAEAFPRLTAAQIARIEPHGRRREVQPGEVLGEPGEPVYDTIVMQGTNAVYNIIGWVGFLLGGYKITGGNSGSLTGSFTEITWQGIPATQGNGPPNLGARVVTLTR